MTVSEILDQYEASRPFYRGGGITVTGGEPLAQKEFVTELFEEACRRDIHTCLDTSGVTFRASDHRAYFRAAGPFTRLHPPCHAGFKAD